MPPLKLLRHKVIHNPAVPFVLTLVAAGQDFSVSARRVIQAAIAYPPMIARGRMMEFALSLTEAQGDSIGRLMTLGRTEGLFDGFLQPAEGRAKKLLAADMESTIIPQEMLDLLGDHLGIGEPIAAITRAAMEGRLDFEQALRERVRLLAGTPVAVLDGVAEKITTSLGAEKLVATIKNHGGHAWLITGGFTYFAEPVAQRLGFDRVVANQLAIERGVVTGDLVGPVIDAAGKWAAVLQACAEYSLTPADVLTLGDGANDLPMLLGAERAGGLGVGYYAKPKVREQVMQQITCTDLKALIPVLGYTDDSVRLG